MSNETESDKPDMRESQTEVGADTAYDEIVAGVHELVQEAKTRNQCLKAGGSSGITGEFGRVDFSPNLEEISITHPEGRGRVIQKVDGSRKEVEYADGRVKATTVTGMTAYQTADGDAAVGHADGTIASLKGDGTVVFWHPGMLAPVAEKLSAVEQDYLSQHPDVDRCALVEIHRRFHSKPEKIEAFYTELQRIEDAGNLTNLEKRELRDTIMYNVAYPAEIFQGTSPTCNVAVIEREFVTSAPENYAKFLVDTLTTGQSTMPIGQAETIVQFNRENLRLKDSSGRNMASRVFQTAATHAYHKIDGKEFVNTEDGVGRVVQDGTLKIEEGLSIGEMRQVLERMTGDTYKLEYVEGREDLARYLSDSGAPIIMSVLGGREPFGGPAEEPHVVTITGVEGETVFVQNQWGLEHDHSVAGNGVSVDSLLMNSKSAPVMPGIVLVKSHE